MDFSDAVFATIGSLITGLLGFLAARSKNKKELSISDRQQLSKDQFEFINDLKEELRQTKEELRQAREEIKELTQQVINLNATNARLENDNKLLQEKIDEMRVEIQFLRDRK